MHDVNSNKEIKTVLFLFSHYFGHLMSSTTMRVGGYFAEVGSYTGRYAVFLHQGEVVMSIHSKPYQLDVRLWLSLNRIMHIL
jgi:hypothetical protein